MLGYFGNPLECLPALNALIAITAIFLYPCVCVSLFVGAYMKMILILNSTRVQTDIPWSSNHFFIFQCCPISKSCSTFCNPMDCGLPAPVSSTISEFAQIHVHWVSDANQPSHLSLPSSAFFSCPPSFPPSTSFPVSWLFASGGQSIGDSASATVLPMNIQDWFLLGLTGGIFLLSKGLFKSLLQHPIWKYQFFGTQPSLSSNSHIFSWVLEKL